MTAGLSRRHLIGASALATVGLPADGASAASLAEKDAPVGSAFAEHHIALQLSERDPHKQALVLSVANNLLKFYGPDLIAVEVVAFGPGIDLLRAESPSRVGVDSLVEQGVRFSVCMNTVDTIERETGRRPVLNAKAVPVQAGVPQLLHLAESGYTLVRP